MRKLVLLFLAFLLFPGTGKSQYRSESVPLESPPYESDILSARPIRYFIGIGPGALFYQHNGNFIPDPEVCNCVFSEYDDVRFHYAGEFSIKYPKLGFAGKILLTYYNFSGRFQYRDEFSTVLPGDLPNEDILFEKTSNVELSYVSITPGFAWYIPRTEVFLLGGVDIGIPVDSKYDNIESIVTEGYAYDSTGTQYEYTFLDDTGIPDVPAVRIGLQFALGIDIKFTERFFATPQIGLTLPLNPVSDKHDTWRVTSEYGVVLLKYRL